jgi:hypothetical protein
MIRRWLLVVPLTLLTALSWTTLAQIKLDAQRTRQFEEQLLYLPNENLLNHFTGGFNTVLADLIWLKCIQHSAQEFRSVDRKYEWIEHMCRTVNRLDPYFVGAYQYGAMFLAAIGADEPALRILKKGIAANPTAWELPLEAANVYILNRATEGGSPAMASFYLALAARNSNAPEYLMQRAYDIQVGHNLLAVGRKIWEDLLATSHDEFMREMAVQKIQELDVRQNCVLLNECVASYTQAHGRAPSHIDELVGGGIINRIPEDPLGGDYLIDSKGKVQNTTILASQAEKIVQYLRSAISAHYSEHGDYPPSLEALVTKGYLGTISPHPDETRQWQYDAVTGELR